MGTFLILSSSLSPQAINSVFVLVLPLSLAIVTGEVCALLLASGKLPFVLLVAYMIGTGGGGNMFSWMVCD